MIRQLVAIFQRAGLDVTAEEMAEALWLAPFLPQSLPRHEEPGVPESESSTAPAPDSLGEPTATTDAPPVQLGTEPLTETPLTLPDYAGRTAGLPTRGSLEVKIPNAFALPDPLEISRSLRPLQRRVDDKGKLVIDERLTAEQIADSGLWIPVMRPRRSRWLEIALVVDLAGSMAIWRQAVRELTLLLERSGAFRDVRTWGLLTDRDSPILVQGSSGGSLYRGRRVDELLNPAGRRLIVVVSDCVSRSWRGGAAHSLLRRLGCRGPVALVQPLPSSLWHRTGLSSGLGAVLTSSVAAVPNVRLRWRTDSSLEEVEDVTAFPLPVVHLDNESIGSWIKMVSGDPRSSVFGTIWLPPVVPTGRASMPGKLTPEERVARFRSAASPRAQKLAGYLSSVPLTMPIMRLVSQSILPAARPVHLAEFFLGGLIREAEEANGDPESVRYEFHEGVDQILMDEVPVSESVEVTRRVSDYVQERMGQAFSFRAALRAPDEFEMSLDQPGEREFARIGSKVLRRLGGRYARLADRLLGLAVPVSGGGRAEKFDGTAGGSPRPMHELRSDRKHGRRKRAETPALPSSRQAPMSWGAPARTSSNHVRVLISYSHDSDAHRERIRDLASRLRGDGIDAWIDQYSPQPAEGWPRWVEREFAKANFIIVACTEAYAERFARPPGVGSGVGWEAVLIRSELYERGSTRFVPVYFDGNADVVPRPLRPYTRYGLPRDYGALRQHLTDQFEKNIPPLGSPPEFEDAWSVRSKQSPVKIWNVPPRPAQYLPREELDAVKVSLISSNAQTVAIAGEHHRLGIQGMPGVGKTVLAAALAFDADIHEAFPGGVFWLTLGRTPDDVVVWQGNLAEALAGHRVEIRTVRDGKAKLSDLFAARPPSLLILDDVWNLADADPFDAPTAPSRMLITTRSQELARGLGATIREIRELKSTDALMMLAAYAGRSIDTLPKVAQDIVRECGELPLAVAMAGAMLQGRPNDQWTTLLERLRKADLEYLAAALPQYRQHRSMLAAIEVSVRGLPEDVRLRYLDFAIFPEDAEIPERVLYLLWGSSGVHLAVAQQTVNMLVDHSLVRRNAEERLTLHDLQHDYVRARAGDLTARHVVLVEAYRSASPGKTLYAVEADGYFFEYIARHVREGEGTAALRALLFDHQWLAAKLEATDANSLLTDFELLDLASDLPLRLLRDALRLSADVLARSPEQLASQLLGRLRTMPEDDLRQLCMRIEADGALLSGLSFQHDLTPPGGPLRWILEEQTDGVYALAVSTDGQTVISGFRDGVLKIWNLVTGQERWALEGHAGPVHAVAVSADGKVAFSGSDDRTLKVWDVETGRERRTLEGHTRSVRAVALSADGKVAISGSDDRTLKVWDVETGLERRTLEGHAGLVSAVALSADGRMVLSGSEDRALKIWDVETGRERRTLEGHTDSIRTVALSGDGRMAVSGSDDRALKVWDVETGQERRTLEGHTGPVHAVALSGDGRMTVSGSDDGALKVWALREQ